VFVVGHSSIFKLSSIARRSRKQEPVHACKLINIFIIFALINVDPIFKPLDFWTRRRGVLR